ncbi:MAG: hypothetical protein WC485_02685 [Opitutaceae bacterium]
MTESTTYQTYATSLLADFQAVAVNSVPRQEIITDWLTDFLLRSKKRGFQMGPSEVADLTAVDRFLRVNKISATARPLLE